MSGLEVIGALASCSQLCTYISRTISFIQTALKELKEAPKRIQQQTENLRSLGLILDSIQRNPLLQNSCIRVHLEQIGVHVNLVKSLLCESSSRIERKSFKSFWYCLYVKPKTEDQILSAFSALESAKSNLQLWILNRFGETFSHLVREEVDSVTDSETIIDSETVSDSATITDSETMPSQAQNSGIKRSPGGGKDKSYPVSTKTAGDPTDSRTPAYGSSGGDRAPESESDSQANRQYEIQASLRDPNIQSLHAGNLLSGKEAEAHFGDVYKNAPEWFLEQQKANANRTAYLHNETKGEKSKSHHGHQWNFEPAGTQK